MTGLFGEPRMATCPNDGEPLVPTMVFSQAEFYCLECGSRFGFLAPRAAKQTEELAARYKVLLAEWEENVGGRLLIAGGWRDDCEKCRPRGESHVAHAAEEERLAHVAAIEWLDARVGAMARSASR